MNLHDFRVAARQLTRRPGFTLIVLVTLALGIGAVTTCFSLLDAVTFRPIPFADPDRLVAVSPRSRLALNTFESMQQLRGVFSGSVAHAARAVTLSGDGVAERVQAAEISGDLFSLLGVPVQRGRPLFRTDTGTPVVVIGNDLWVRGFGGNPNVVGSTLALNGDRYVIVGVAREGFSFPQNSRLWTPLERAAGADRVDVVARLEPGVSTAQAAEAVRGFLVNHSIAFPGEQEDRFTTPLTPLREVMIGAKQRDMALFVLSAAVLVLLVACANLAGLLTAYLASRKHEFALRTAIGANRMRLVRQLMTESCMLALTGGAIGVLIAQWSVDALAVALGKPQGADWIEFTVNGRVLTFALLITMLAAVLFGLAPALGGTRTDLRTVLQEENRAVGPAGRPRRFRGLLVAGQLALSIGLVAGAISVVVSSIRFDEVDVGFRRAGLLALRVALAGRAYEQPEQRLAFTDAAAARLRSLPGVSSVAVASEIPLVDRDVSTSAFLPDRTDATERLPFATLRFVDAAYVAAMGIQVHQGRAFTAEEARSLRDRVVVINDTLVRRFWPGSDPIGRRLLLRRADLAGWYTVVGVVADVAQRQIPAAPENQIYLPLPHARTVTLAVRASSDPVALAAPARDLVQSVDRSLAVVTTTMDGAYAWYVRDRQLQGAVLGSLGAIAMLLAALGVYGVMSLTVADRRREIAIRMALGSSPAAVLRLVLARAISLASAGVGAGLFLALGLTTFLSSIFLGVRAFDGFVLATAAGFPAAMVLLSSVWPARRAMRVDPMVTLKD